MCSSVVPVLQQYVKNLKQENEKLLQRCEENEQCGKRLCMRMTGIPSQKNESGEDVKNSVKSIIEESGCDIPDSELYRAHRTGKNVRPIIVSFTRFREIHIISES